MIESKKYAHLRNFLENGEEDLFFENPFIGITITDGDGTILTVNPSQSRITAMDKSQWVGRNVHDLAEAGILINSGTIQIMKTGQPGTVHQRLGNGKNFYVQAYPIRDDDDVMRYVLNYLIDVSDLNSLKEELCKVRNENLEITRTLDSLRSMIFQEQRLVYSSKKIQSLVNTLDLVADSDTTVLITGASGVGKEMIARELHAKSHRRDQPFVKISCEAIPATLLESELFGYEAGAFTGAGKNGKIGLFEEADKGTVFLDEVGEIPPELQVKLLQVLQEHAVRRIGSTKKIPVDIRVIAATNANLRQMIREKKFREDLFYRLNVIPLQVPGLDQRKEDIPLLAQHFLDLFNTKYGKRKAFSLDAAAYLATLKYEGNVRQLRNLIERAVLLSPAGSINVADVRAVYELRDGEEIIEEPQAAAFDRPLRQTLEEREREVLQACWVRYRNETVVAKVLEVSQPTISRKLKKYNICVGAASSQK